MRRIGNSRLLFTHELLLLLLSSSPPLIAASNDVISSLTVGATDLELVEPLMNMGTLGRGRLNTNDLIILLCRCHSNSMPLNLNPNPQLQLIQFNAYAKCKVQSAKCKVNCVEFNVPPLFPPKICVELMFHPRAKRSSK